MTSPAGVKTRICMISDTHTNTPRPARFTDYPFRNPLPKADILIHAGDLTKLGYYAEHETTIAMLKAADAELKLVIAGNHDITLDEDHFTSFGFFRHRRILYKDLAEQSSFDDDEQTISNTLREGHFPPPEELKAYARSAKDLYTNQAAWDSGIWYLEEGTHTFTLSNGASFSVYASPYQPEFFRWAFAYPRDEDRFNVPVDIMLTHGPPFGILDRVRRGGLHVGCENLLEAAERARPRLYLYGHIHEAWGSVRGVWDAEAGGGVSQEDIPTDQEEMLDNRCAFYDASSTGERPLRFGKETIFVNASICTLSYDPRNAPWVMDFDLPTGNNDRQEKPGA
ncbi:hypothetical protein N7470_008231 [Penicillium chermesinum]|nr:hypothetical protein N7470_008231 [Penicillium chermesinum]